MRVDGKREMLRMAKAVVESGLVDDDMIKVASDLYADQTTEIDFMQKMLDAMSSQK